ncbi:putative membrane protein [Paenibacillus mucilaginosus]
MIMTNSEIRKSAREALTGNWGHAVLFVLLTTAVNMFFGYLSDDRVEVPWLLALVIFLANIFFSTMITTGYEAFFLSISRGDRLGIGQVIDYSFKHFWPFFKLTLAMGLKILAWTLLLIIPGIIAGIRYAQALNIKIDNPQVGSFEAIRMSSELMDGHKWRYFCLQLSFIGWALGCLLTLGIGFLWLASYYKTSMAEFYNLLISRNGSHSSIEE